MLVSAISCRAHDDTKKINKVDFTVDKLPPGQPPQEGDCPIHRIVLPENIPLIENLTNLDKLVGREFELFALPIKIYKGDGAAARAVARIF